MLQDWQIQHRSDRCAQTGRPFAKGEHFYTVLVAGKEGLHRLDLSEEAWKQRVAEAAPGDAREAAPFCFWRAKFQPPASSAAPETLPKENAESLLRQYLSEGRPDHVRASYILALMLERKRLLRPIETRQSPDNDTTLLVYEHAKTGETFLVIDPQLRLDQLAEVQAEVADLLAPVG